MPGPKCNPTLYKDGWMDVLYPLNSKHVQPGPGHCSFCHGNQQHALPSLTAASKPPTDLPPLQPEFNNLEHIIQHFVNQPIEDQNIVPHLEQFPLKTLCIQNVHAVILTHL